MAEVAAALGITLLPWQQQVLDVALEHEDGRLVYRDVLVSVPRQSGKSTMAFALVAWRMLAAPSHAVYGAQSRLSARQKVLDDWGAHPAPVQAVQRLYGDAWDGSGVDSLDE